MWYITEYHWGWGLGTVTRTDLRRKFTDSSSLLIMDTERYNSETTLIVTAYWSSRKLLPDKDHRKDLLQ